MTETWVAAPGYEGIYEVSDLGNLRRISTYGRKPKAICRPVRPHHKKRHGYNDYWLQRDGKTKRFSAHRLVWAAFNGPIADGLEINHKNGQRRDNRLSNLEAVTRSDNCVHKFWVLGAKTNFKPQIGEKNKSAKLTEDQVREIRRLYTTGLFQYEIGKMFGVSQRTVCLITRREKWTHVD